MLMFLLTLSVISLILAALIHEQDAVAGKIDSVLRINKAEAAARAVECWIRSGGVVALDFSADNVSYSIEQNHFHVEEGNKVIEVGGVFYADRAEPM